MPVANESKEVGALLAKEPLSHSGAQTVRLPLGPLDSNEQKDPVAQSTFTLPITPPVDLSKRDNKGALIVKKDIETNDAGVFGKVVVEVAREL